MCGSPSSDVGLAGLSMLQICVSPAHEATATSFGMCTWMSWHAWNPRLNVVSVLSSFSRTVPSSASECLMSMIEILR